jgi:hypothetical protein
MVCKIKIKKRKTFENQMINKGLSTQGGNRTHTPESTGF